MYATRYIQNRTLYYVPTISRQYIPISNPELHSNKSLKMDGYETRLYYEFEHTKAKGGFTQFVTLTYNDKHLPKFYGQPCLSRQDLRDFLHDKNRFFKDLGKKHGYTFKYFIGSEFGEGGETHNYKGKRGAGNNPHYHILFFFKPYEGCPDAHLTPKEVAESIKHYWQGKNRTARNYKKGIVSFGSVDKYGVVADFKAIAYTAKYCVKDAYFKQCEDIIAKKAYPNIMKDYYFHCKTSALKGELPLDKTFFVQSKTAEILAEFRKNHTTRVLISKGVGISALDSIKDKMNPTVKVATDKGFKTRPVPMYIYRKLFYDIRKDADGKYYYKLNKLGKQYKMEHLQDIIRKKAEKTLNNYNIFVRDSELLKDFINGSDCPYMCPFAHLETPEHINYETGEITHGEPVVTISDEGLKAFENLFNINADINKPNNIFFKYAIYETIYRSRFFRLSPFGDFPTLDILRDYRTSLQDTHKPMFKCYDMEKAIHTANLLPYSEHPYFSDDLCLFDFFNSINSFVCVQNDRKAQKRYENYKKLKRIENNMKYGTKTA